MLHVPDPATYERTLRAWRRSVFLHEAADRELYVRVLRGVAHLRNYEFSRHYYRPEVLEHMSDVDTQVYEDALFLHYCIHHPMPLP